MGERATSAADTICALASGPGRAGVAVIRLSGPAAGASLFAMAGPSLDPRVATLRAICDPRSGALLDRGLALWFPAPNSFTGEDCAELQVHGGPAVVGAVLDALTALPQVRLAEPGEFTRRAFENGKLDLAEVEGLADLIEAETEGQRRQALAQMEGALSGLVEGWRGRLVTALAMLEAAIDFPDEDLPEDVAARALAPLTALQTELEAHLADARRGERTREGYRIAIIGAPNAGKSSLLNALAGREAAIVSDIPGTTRDVIEVRLTLAGFPVWIADTAGLREAADAIEAEGVRRALARAEEADLRIGLVEAGGAVEPALAAALRGGDLLVWSKADLAPVEALAHGLAISVVAGDGLEALTAALEARVAADLGAREAAPLTRLRHRRAVEDAVACLHRAKAAFALGPELAAEEARLAARALGRIVGRVDVEDVLGEVFASFCIGK